MRLSAGELYALRIHNLVTRTRKEEMLEKAAAKYISIKSEAQVFLYVVLNFTLARSTFDVEEGTIETHQARFL